MNDPVKYTSTCRLCRHEFKAPAFVPMVGGAPDPRIIKLGMAFFQHMAERHQQEMGALLIVAAFHVTDPVLLNMFESWRHTVHRNTRKNDVTEAALRDKLAHTGLDAAAIETVLPFVLQLRDFLTEEGNHAPPAAPPPPSPIVTA